MTTTERLRELERAEYALLQACEGLMRRMEINELVNRPNNPCNHYDQPAYDAAMSAVEVVRKSTTLAAMLNALPAMLAVVEAAEAYATACDQSVGEKLMRLQSALAAFREVRE